MSTSSKDLLYLLRILDAIGKILHYTSAYTKPEDFLFKNEQRDYNASLQLLMHIGEQTVKIFEATKINFSDIAWTRLKALRNRVAHDYINVDTFIIFNLIKNQLPQLQNQIIHCIKMQVHDGVFSKVEIEISKGSIYYLHIDIDNLLDL